MLRFLILILTFTFGCVHSKNPTFAKWSNKDHDWNVPIKVYNDAEVTWFSNALNMWNQPGCKVFIETKDMMDADVMVIRGSTMISGNKKKKGKNIKLAGVWNKNGVITIFGGGSSLRDFAVLEHELGHSLGLKHDYKLPSSIMMPGGLSRFSSGFSPRPTDVDLAAIKLRYCK